MADDLAGEGKCMRERERERGRGEGKQNVAGSSRDTHTHTHIPTNSVNQAFENLSNSIFNVHVHVHVHVHVFINAACIRISMYTCTRINIPPAIVWYIVA